VKRAWSKKDACCVGTNDEAAVHNHEDCEKDEKSDDKHKRRLGLYDAARSKSKEAKRSNFLSRVN